MKSADEENFVQTRDFVRPTTIADFLEVTSSVDILQEYRPDRNTSGQITSYLLSDYFDFCWHLIWSI